MAYEFRFPDIGEGVTEGELLAWKVAEGDPVAEGDTLAEVETDKAVVELPSPRAGRVAKLHAAEGDVIEVGAVVVTIDETVGGSPTDDSAQPQVSAGEAPYTGSVVGTLEEAPAEEVPPPASPPVAPPVAPPTPTPSSVAVPPVAPPMPGEPGPQVLAMPSVRALAKELGVDLSTVRGTGAGGRILRQDVQDVAEQRAYGVVPSLAASAAVSLGVAAPIAGQDGAAPGPAETTAARLGGVMETGSFGPLERVAFRGVRRAMAKRMAASAAKQAQVTTMDDADVTVIRRIREKERSVAEERGVRLTYLAFVIKACTAALQRFPRLNASLEESGDEFVVRHYYNIGVAIDTPNGLVVPNIKAADSKSIFQIAQEVVDLARKAEERRLDLADLHGGTFTITNYGAIGSTYATPIVNYPEAAILGTGRVREMPVVRDAQVVPRLLLPLALTFDHRLIDGAEAARFLNVVIGYLEDPDLLLLEGA